MKAEKYKEILRGKLGILCYNPQMKDLQGDIIYQKFQAGMVLNTAKSHGWIQAADDEAIHPMLRGVNNESPSTEVLGLEKKEPQTIVRADTNFSNKKKSKK